jgi:hypothetical protein
VEAHAPITDRKVGARKMKIAEKIVATHFLKEKHCGHSIAHCLLANPLDSTLEL